jgi:hypothetical protein
MSDESQAVEDGRGRLAKLVGQRRKGREKEDNKDNHTEEREAREINDSGGREGGVIRQH